MTDPSGPEVAGGPPEEADDRFVVRVTVSAAQADELLRREGLDFGDHPHIDPRPDGTGSLILFMTRGEARALEREGLRVELGDNMSARARERLAEIGRGDRFEGGRVVPRGIGRKIGGRGQGGGQQPGAGRPR
jgi:hypothetical protein